METKIYQIINDEEQIELLADEIAESFIEEANQDNIDYSFTVNHATGEIKTMDANTFFVFDTKPGSNLELLKTAMFAEDLANIKENSAEEEQLVDDIKQFLKKVSLKTIEKHKDEIQRTVRRVVLDNKVNQETVPLDKIEILSIDIADYTSIPEPAKYLLKIGKMPDTECRTDEIIQYVQQKEEEENKTVEDIFKEEKDLANPLFTNIVSIEKGRKFLNDICLLMFIDYSVVVPTAEEND
jgi:hypothetical protein